MERYRNVFGLNLSKERAIKYVWNGANDKRIVSSNAVETMYVEVAGNRWA